MKYSCKCCKFETTFKKNYVSHLSTQKHINNFKTNKYCDICQKDYSSVKTFKVHYKREHSDNKDNTDKKDNNNDDIINNVNSNGKIFASKKILHSDDAIIDTNIDKSTNISYGKIKDIVDQSNKENSEKVVNVVNKAITKASELIKYLMIHHSETPPLKKITQTNCNKLLKNYNCPNKTEIEIDLLYDYNNKFFVKNISQSILSYVNHKKPTLQPIWNTVKI